MKRVLIVFVLLLVLALSACDFGTKEEVFYILGEGQDTVEINTSWEDAGAWLEQGITKIDSDSVEGSVDVTTVGTYEITYITDYDEEHYTITRYVVVVDQTKPVITLLPGLDTIQVGDEWIDGGISYSDNSIGGLTVLLDSGTLDVNTAGTYIITYTVTDLSGNTQTAERYVTVTE